MEKIQWNKVTWYSKLIALAVFIVLPFVFFYYGVRYGTAVGYLKATQEAHLFPPASSSPTGNGETAYYQNPAAWQTDANNTAGGFSIAYPIDFDTQDNIMLSPSTDWRIDANGVPGVAYFTLTVPRAFEPQTNFAGATLTVGASGNAAAIAQCMEAGASSDPSAATSTAAVNDTDFTVFHSTGVGAGNYYNTTSYRTLHAGKCYAVEYTVHSTQIMNYPASYGLHPYDQQKIDTLMQTIIGTFTFN